MRLVHGRPPGAPSALKGDTFVGDVWSEPVLPTTDGTTINAITFTPGARTNWHSHERGQILQVTAGAGWVCTHGEPPRPLRAGDVVWVPPHERHWHGAGASTLMAHTAISLGTTDWSHEVSDEEYAASAGVQGPLEEDHDV